MYHLHKGGVQRVSGEGRVSFHPPDTPYQISSNSLG